MLEIDKHGGRNGKNPEDGVHTSFLLSFKIEAKQEAERDRQTDRQRDRDLQLFSSLKVFDNITPETNTKLLLDYIYLIH